MSMLSVTLRKRYSAFFLPLVKFLGIRGRLKYFIQTNGLYLLDDNKKISVSTKVAFKKIRSNGDKYLEIKLLKNGSKLDGCLTDFRANVQGLFGAEVVAVQNEPKFVRYLICLKTARGVVNLSSSVVVERCGYINLNKNKKWEYLKRPHALLAGNTGTGKTYLLVYLIREAIRENARVWVMDGKNDELTAFARALKIKTIGNTSEEIKHFIELAEVEMNRRYALGHKRFRPFFLFVDEFATLALDMPKKDYQEMLACLKSLVLKGRRANIHLVFSLQRPSAESLPLDIRDNLDLRIGLGDLSPQAFEMVFGISKTASEILSKGVGQGYMATGFSAVEAYEAPELVK
jgi:S-DNA-T family DNA segregation ATPase FtsK/SpoIIIE